MKTKSLLVVGCISLSTIAVADVAYDENGNGFVGKGDIQALLDWNNSTLQENAESLQFRMIAGGSATWTCSGLNGSGRPTTQTHSTETEAVNALVSVSPRKNNAGQVTGFVLEGTELGSVSYSGVGTCPPANGWQQPPTLDPDSIQYDSEPLLQVSPDGEQWYDLPVTE